MSKVILVLAPNSRFFKEFMRSKTPTRFSYNSFISEGKEYRYISRPHEMRGYMSADVLFISGWTNFKTSEEIDEIISISKMLKVRADNYFNNTLTI